MKGESAESAFAFPKSYVGRAVLYLFFFAPLALSVSHALRMFLFSLVDGIRKLCLYRAELLEEPRIVAYKNPNAEIAAEARGFVDFLVREAMAYTYIYFDAVISIAALALPVWLVVRFRRNGAFGARQWFAVFAGAGVLFGGIPYIVPALNGECPFDFSFYGILYFAKNAFEIFLFVFFAKYLFEKVPYCGEPLWAREEPLGKFAAANFRAIVSSVCRAGWLKAVCAVLGVLAYELLCFATMHLCR